MNAFINFIVRKTLQYKQLLARVEHLEEANRQKVELLSVVGHDLRAPMAAIMGLTSLQIQGFYGQLSAEQSDCLNRVKTTAESMLELLNRLLNLSQISSHSITCSSDVFNVRTLAQDVVNAVEPLARQKGIAVQVEGSSGLWMRSDRIRMWQVLVNLMNNAVKFTDRGNITLAFRRSQNPQRVILEIRDTGMGIAPEELSKLFQEFKPLSISSIKQGGTGLGLSLCKKILDRLGAFITVESQPGAGSTFRIEMACGVEPLVEDDLPPNFVEAARLAAN